jgi:hypothetical protein
MNNKNKYRLVKLIMAGEALIGSEFQISLCAGLFNKSTTSPFLSSGFLCSHARRIITGWFLLLFQHP